MAGWKEMSKNNRIHKTATECTGTRLFLWTPDGNETLPTMNEQWPAQDTDELDFPMYVKDMNREWAGDHPGIPQWTVQYSNIPQPSENDGLIDLLKSGDIGGEFLNIGKATGALWDDDEPIEQDMFKRVVTVTFKIPKIFKTFESFCNTMTENAGSINEKEFLKFDPEQVLFLGASCAEIRNSRGQKRWKAEMNFSARAPQLDDEGHYGGWQHLWNEKAGKWQKPKAENLIYTMMDFNVTLFTVTLV